MVTGGLLADWFIGIAVCMGGGVGRERGIEGVLPRNVIIDYRIGVK